MSDLTHILSSLPEPNVLIDGYDNDGKLHLCARKDTPTLQWMGFNMQDLDITIEQWTYSEPRKTLSACQKTGMTIIKVEGPVPEALSRAVKEKHQWIEEFQNSGTTSKNTSFEGRKFLTFDNQTPPTYQEGEE